MLCIALTVLCSCGTGARRPVALSPTGPPFVRLAVVYRHAEQFDSDLVPRPAGSQQELAAATYMLGHLQKAGYVARLDAVPVEDLVRSTNVVALPPSGGKPEVVVTVAYDDPEGGTEHGTDLGLFLEVARALNALEDDHSVEFAALGAEETDVNGGRLGSRRLARVLLDEGSDPIVVALGGTNGGGLCATGPPAEALRRASGDRVAECNSDAQQTMPLRRAGFAHVVVGGPPGALGDALVEFLSSRR